MERSWLSLFGGRSWRKKLARLVVYTHLTSYDAKLVASPCNHTSMGGLIVQCLCFTIGRRARFLAKRKGWQPVMLRKVGMPSYGDVFKVQVAPHTFSLFAGFDYSVYVRPHITLSLPGVFLTISRCARYHSIRRHAFTDNGCQFHADPWQVSHEWRLGGTCALPRRTVNFQVQASAWQPQPRGLDLMGMELFPCKYGISRADRCRRSAHDVQGCSGWRCMVRRAAAKGDRQQ